MSGYTYGSRYTIGYAQRWLPAWVRPVLMGLLLVLLVGPSPAFSQGTTLVSNSVRAGAWSDPGTWDVRPARDRRVVIRHAVTINQPAESGRVDVLAGGALQLASTLNAYGSVTVYGTLKGSRGALLFHVPDDRQFNGNTVPGPDPKLPDYHVGDIGLWGLRGAVIQLIGPEVTPWLNAVPASTGGSTPVGFGAVNMPTIGGGRTRLEAAPVGWEAGDTLLLTALDGRYTLASLVQQNGADIIYAGADDFKAPSLAAEERIARPKVANLSRRLVIASALVKEGDTNHRAHTAFLNCGCDACAGQPVELVNVEFRNLGPRGKLGRYPVHFHLLGAVQTNVRLEGSSIWQSVSEPGNRFVSVHDTRGVTVRNNVALRSQGHGYFMESGPEISNTFARNLSVDVRGPEELFVRQVGDWWDNRFGTYHYWVRAGNTLQGNVAVGPHPDVLPGAMTVTGKPVLASEGSVTLLPAGVIDGQKLPSVSVGDEALGSGKYALDSARVGSQFLNPVATYCQSSALGFGNADRLLIANPTFLFNGDKDVTYGAQLFVNNSRDLEVQGGLLVGKVGLQVHYASTLSLTGTRIRGNAMMNPTYWEFGMQMEGCDLQLSATSATEPALLFQSIYPPRRNSPGLLRMRNCTGKVGNSVYSGASPLAGDYSLNVMASFPYPVFPGGTPVDRSAKRLTSAPVASGYLRVPGGYYSRAIVVPPGGSLYGWGRNWLEDEKRWQAGLSTPLLGYPDGLPPGTYDVWVITMDNKQTVKRGVVIRSGQVTDFATLP